MDLLYKPDWEKTKERYKEWWAHEYFGRCVVDIRASKKSIRSEEPPKLPQKLEDRWLDFDYLAKTNEYRMKHTYYGGEAFPVWHPGYPGCDTHSAYLGASVVLNETTCWRDTVIEEGELKDHDYNSLKIDKDNRWWKFGRQIRQFAVKQSKGKSIPGNMAFGGCGDTLASLRSTNKLLLDVMDCPDYVREFDIYLMKQWIEIYEKSYKITSRQAEGSTCFLNLWSPGKFYVAHNDFAYMISPEMYVDIFLPTIEMQAEYLDHVVYHVDGVGNFKHVDAILQVDGIQALQILPGAGMPSPLHYMDILKKVQAAGRNLYIYLAPEEVKDALDVLSARGLSIQTFCETEEDARALLKCVEKWSVDRG